MTKDQTKKAVADKGTNLVYWAYHGELKRHIKLPGSVELTYSYSTPTFALESDMFLACRKDLTLHYAPPDVNPRTLEHEEGFIPKFEMGTMNRGIVYKERNWFGL